MHLYALSAQTRPGRPTITLPRRTGRPVLTVPRRGPVADVCRCGSTRTPQEHLQPWRDCARCTAQLAH